MELQGKIIHALDPKTGSSSRGEWKVQEFVLETQDGQYSRKMVFSVFGEDRLQRFNIQEGQEVSVSFDIDAREYNGRWFNSIRAFDVRPVMPSVNQPISPVDGQTVPPFTPPGYIPPMSGPNASINPAQPVAEGNAPEDELPF